MQKEFGKEYEEKERVTFLKDNCDSAEQVDYKKEFTPDEIKGLREQLAELSINIRDIEIEKKDAISGFKAALKPLMEEKNDLLTSIKSKGEEVSELCYKFIYHEEGMVGFYNKSGDLVYARGIKPEEMQGNLFMKRTGTND